MSEKKDNRFAQSPLEDTYWSSDKDKKLLSLQEQNKCHENSIMTLLKAKHELEEENSQLKKKLEQSERNFLKKSKEVDNIIGEKQTLEENINKQISQETRRVLQEKKQEFQISEKTVKDCQDRVQTVEKENVIVKQQLQIKMKECDDLKIRVQTVEKENVIVKQQLQIKMKECDDLKIRLTQVAGADIEAGNTSIADLGYKYKPTRIAELYSELYDNEWTEAVDDLVSTKWSENIIVRHLLITLQGCYKACCQLSSQQMQDLVQKLFLDRSSSDVTQFLKQHTSEIKQLMDARKAIAINVAHVISKDFEKNHTFAEYLHSHEWLDEGIVYQITKHEFFEKCITLSWLMSVQDPEMYMDVDVEYRTKFDNDRYREYTKSGPLFLCSIWPALHLHKNGPLMIKGVAQACD